MSVLAWFVNLGGFPGGAPALLAGLPIVAVLVARRSLRGVLEPGLWLATSVVVALTAAGIVLSQAVPGHDALEDRLAGLRGLGQLEDRERQGSTTCRPECAGVTVRYRSSATPDVAAASAFAVLTADGFEPVGPAPLGLAIGTDGVRLRDGRVTATVSAAKDGDRSSLRISLQGAR